MGPSKLSRNSARRSGDAGAIGISSLGNTAGTSGTQQLGTYVLQGTNGITLSQLTGAGQATLVISGAAAGPGIQTFVLVDATGGSVTAGPSAAGIMSLSMGGGISIVTQGGFSSILRWANLAGAQRVAVRTGLGAPVTWGGANSLASAINFGSATQAIDWGVSTDGGGGTITLTPKMISYWHNGSIAAAGVANDVQVNLPMFQRWVVPSPMSATRMDMDIQISNSSSGGGSVTISVALYSFTQSSISTISTASRTFGYGSQLTVAGQSSHYTDVSGHRFRSISLGTWNITPGEYMLGMVISIATALTSGTYRFLAGRNFTFNGNEYAAVLGTDNQYFADGYLTNTSTNLAGGIVMANLSHTGNDPLAQPWVTLLGTF